MPPLEESEKTAVQPAKVGSHLARCFRVVALGHQREEYKGKVRYENQILFSFELPFEMRQFGDKELPVAVHPKYNYVFAESSKWRTHIQSWMGVIYNSKEEMPPPNSFIDKVAFLTIAHTSGGKEKVNNIMPADRDYQGNPVQCPPMINPGFLYSVWNHNQQVFEQLPDWIKERVEDSPEYQSRVLNQDISNHHYTLWLNEQKQWQGGQGNAQAQTPAPAPPQTAPQAQGYAVPPQQKNTGMPDDVSETLNQSDNTKGVPWQQ